MPILDRCWAIWPSYLAVQTNAFCARSNSISRFRMPVPSLRALPTRVVIVGRSNDRDILKILCGSPNHRRTADIDVFDGFFELDAGFSNGLDKRIQIYANQIDQAELCSAICCMCSGFSRIASSPAAIRGLSVFTRPSRISGKPVRSETSRTGIPLDARSREVPPVETISTLSAAKPSGKFDNSGLVIHADQRAFNSSHTILPTYFRSPFAVFQIWNQTFATSVTA